MKYVLASVLLAAASSAGAAPINATSVTELFHSYTINSGSVPTGLRLGTAGLDLGSDTETEVNDPTAVNSTITNVQVGNPFADPPLPYLASRTNRTTVNGGLEGSQAQFDVSILSVDDPDANPVDTSIVERIVDNSGAARVFLSGTDVRASASSEHLIERSFSFENESVNPIAFNIVGEVTAGLLASHDGTAGFARASGRLYTEFVDLVGTDITYLPLAPYLRSIEDDDSGASVSENLVTSGGAFTGFDFTAAASAIADGTPTEATFFDAGFRYLFQVQMDPGATFNMITGARQANAVLYEGPPSSPIPLPAAAWLLLASLGGLAVIKGRTAPSSTDA